MGQGGLSAAGLSDQSDRVTFWDIEGHLFEDRSVILIAEVDRIEANC